MPLTVHSNSKSATNLKKSNPQNRNLQKTSKFQLKQAQNKQLARLQKNPQLHKRTSPNSWETARLATLN